MVNDSTQLFDYVSNRDCIKKDHNNNYKAQKEYLFNRVWVVKEKKKKKSQEKFNETENSNSHSY